MREGSKLPGSAPMKGTAVYCDGEHQQVRCRRVRREVGIHFLDFSLRLNNLFGHRKKLPRGTFSVVKNGSKDGHTV